MRALARGIVHKERVAPFSHLTLTQGNPPLVTGAPWSPLSRLPLWPLLARASLRPPSLRSTPVSRPGSLPGARALGLQRHPFDPGSWLPRASALPPGAALVNKTRALEQPRGLESAGGSSVRGSGSAGGTRGEQGAMVAAAAAAAGGSALL